MTGQIPARLVCLNRPTDPINLGWDKGELTIGRAPDNDIVLEDLNVSRMHAVFSVRGVHWVLTDTSLNGTRLCSVGQSAVVLDGKSRRLRHNDELVFGTTCFRFHFNQAAIGAAGETPPLSPRVGITPGEYKVLMELSRPFREVPGRAPAANAQIEAALHLSAGGVRRHLKSLYGKFEVSEGTQAQRRVTLAGQWWRATVGSGSDYR